MIQHRIRRIPVSRSTLAFCTDPDTLGTSAYWSARCRGPNRTRLIKKGLSYSAGKLSENLYTNSALLTLATVQSFGFGFQFEGLRFVVGIQGLGFHFKVLKRYSGFEAGRSHSDGNCSARSCSRHLAVVVPVAAVCVSFVIGYDSTARHGPKPEDADVWLPRNGADIIGYVAVLAADVIGRKVFQSGSFLLAAAPRAACTSREILVMAEILHPLRPLIHRLCSPCNFC